MFFYISAINMEKNTLNEAQIQQKEIQRRAKIITTTVK